MARLLHLVAFSLITSPVLVEQPTILHAEEDCMRLSKEPTIRGCLGRTLAASQASLRAALKLAAAGSDPDHRLLLISLRQPGRIIAMLNAPLRVTLHEAAL